MDKKEYEYIDLVPHRQEIRLLHLLPGTWQDGVSCTLEVATLNDNPRYETLSYVWGDTTATSPIYLESCSFPVTHNLHSALRRLRHNDKERVMWVDQLCINQLNDNEKTQQVMLMPIIYSNCQEGFCWLAELDARDKEFVNGEREPEPEPGRYGDGTIRSAFNLLELIASGDHMFDLSCFQFTKPSSLYIKPDFASAFQGLRRIVELPYWDRIWTIQEQILPPKVTITFGPYTIPLRVLLAAGESILLHHWQTCCALAVDSLTLEDRVTLQQVFFKTSIINNILSGYKNSKNILIEVLQTVRNRNATDTRDKVFGVLGLVNNWLETPPILPDYTLTDIEVFAQATMNWITSRRDLFILTGNMLRRPHIPSWIQDWAPTATFDGTEYRHETGWNMLYWKYSASHTKRARSKLLPNSELQLDGIFVDKVSRVASQMVTNDWNDAKFYIDSWEEFIDISNNSARDYIGGGTVYDAFWRTLVGNHFWTGAPLHETSDPTDAYRKVVPEDRPVFDLLKEQIRLSKPQQHVLSDETAGFEKVLPLTARYRTLFITQKGYLGIGTAGIKEGDDVYIFYGGKIPFITRSKDETSDLGSTGTAHNRCELIGDCYLHGAMEGNLIKDSEEDTDSVILC